ncbi:recombinase family protein [Roseicyclus sp.]|uniref:recombinase family protein n=1 Tax=Roseicyclus sp. TaxID=1914329 RepID=UPI003F6C44DC
MSLSYRYSPQAKAQTILYLRLSAVEQSTSAQRHQAESAGYLIDKVIADHSVPGVSTAFSEREGGKRLFESLRDGDVVLVRWLDRLGHNYDDIQRTMSLFFERGVTVKTIINGLTFDAQPKDAEQKTIRDAMMSFMSAMAQAQAISNREAQAAGIANAKARNPTAYKGRKPSYTRENIDHIKQMSDDGVGVNEIARRLGLSKFLVSRINKNPSAAYDALERWGIGAEVPQKKA